MGPRELRRGWGHLMKRNHPEASRSQDPQLMCTNHLGKGSGQEATGEMGEENQKGIHNGYYFLRIFYGPGLV